MRNAHTISKVLGWVWVVLILPFAWISIQVIEPLSRKEFPQNLYDTTLGFLFLPGLPIILTCSMFGLLLLATIITGIITLFDKKEDPLLARPVTLSTAVQQGRDVFVANTQHEKYRRSVLDQIHSVWITGFLESSFDQAKPLQLRLRRRLDIVTNPWGEEIQEITQFPQLLPKGTEIIDVYHEAGRKLLILGRPGAGKTTLSLELAETLLNRAENDHRERIPVVLTLSSWGRNRQPLATWLVNELKHLYKVRKSVAKSWIHNDRLILLLDGLDEVRPTSVRTLCIEAINAYLQKYPFASIVICCRQKEYLSQQTYLQLHHAVSIQPLTPQQIEEYVKSLGKQTMGILTVLRDDPSLLELAKTPLMLRVLLRANEGITTRAADMHSSLEERRRRVFATYVEQMLSRGKPNSRYPFEATIRWLNYLARQLIRHNQVEFLSTQIYSTWLPTQRLRSYCHITTTLLIVISYALIGWWASADIDGLFGRLVGILVGGLVGGVVSTIVRKWKGVEEEREEEIGDRDQFEKWIASNLLFGLIVGSIAGLVAGAYFFFGLLFASIIPYITLGRRFHQKKFLFPGQRLLSVREAMLILFTRVAPKWLVRRIAGKPLNLGQNVLVSNQSIKDIGVICGFALGSILGVFVGVVGDLHGIGVGNILIYIIGTPLLLVGLGIFAQLGVIYGILWWEGYTPKPWEYGDFLNYAAEHILLHKVGRSYIFLHPLLQDYFASLDAPPSEEALTAPVPLKPDEKE